LLGRLGRAFLGRLGRENMANCKKVSDSLSQSIQKTTTYRRSAADYQLKPSPIHACWCYHKPSDNQTSEGGKFEKQSWALGLQRKRSNEKRPR